MKKSLERKSAHPQDVLSKKSVTSFWEKDKLLDKWAEFISELFEDHRKDCNIMKRNFAGPPLMKDEIQAAIRMMK